MSGTWLQELSRSSDIRAARRTLLSDRSAYAHAWRGRLASLELQSDLAALYFTVFHARVAAEIATSAGADNERILVGNCFLVVDALAQIPRGELPDEYVLDPLAPEEAAGLRPQVRALREATRAQGLLVAGRDRDAENVYGNLAELRAGAPADELAFYVLGRGVARINLGADGHPDLARAGELLAAGPSLFRRARGFGILHGVHAALGDHLEADSWADRLRGSGAPEHAVVAFLRRGELLAERAADTQGALVLF